MCGYTPFVLVLVGVLEWLVDVSLRSEYSKLERTDSGVAWLWLLGVLLVSYLEDTFLAPALP